MNPYEDLKIHKNATQDEIKTAYRNLAKKHHPDKGGAINAMEKLNKAYTILKNVNSRKEYDETGKTETQDIRSQAIGLLTKFYIEFSQGEAALRTDLTKLAKYRIDELFNKVRKNIKKEKVKIEKYNKINSKLKCKGPTIFLINALNFEIETCNKTISNLKKELKTLSYIKYFIKFLKYDYDKEKWDAGPQRKSTFMIDTGVFRRDYI